MGQLALLKFNNYYNRTIKRFDTFTEYRPYLCAGNQFGINPFICSFKINDGVETEQVINWDGEAPDYVIDVDDGFSTRIGQYNQLIRSSSLQSQTVGNLNILYNEGAYKLRVTGTATPNYRFVYDTATFHLEPGKYLLQCAGDLNCRVDLTYCGGAATVTPSTGGLTVVGSQTYGESPVIIDISVGAQYALFYTLLDVAYPASDPNASYPMLMYLNPMYGMPPYGDNAEPTLDEIVSDWPKLNDVVNGYEYNAGETISLNGHCTRWFVIENKRLRGGQWKLTLHRDLVADYMEQIVDAPTFIEKAHVQDYDPAIFNNEDMTFNQIKQSETLLQDRTHASYIVGYIDRTVAQSADDTVNVEQYSPSADINVNTLAGWEFYNIIGSPQKYNTFSYEIFQKEGITQNYRNRSVSATKAEVNEYLRSYHNVIDAEDSADIIALNGKTLYESSTGNYYRINLKTTKLNKQTVEPVEPTSALGIAIMARTHRTGTIKLLYECWAVQIVLDKITTASGITATISKDRAHLTDAPYDMFCIPYVDGDFWSVVGQSTIKRHLSRDFAMRVAMAISRQYSGTHLYDIQMLPYFPMPEQYYDDTLSAYDLPASESGKTYNVVDAKSNITIGGESLPMAAIIFWCSNSSFMAKLDYPIDVDDLKISNECDRYRITSPNYAGAFDFSAAKNRGVDYFTAECTYFPITPYIHVAPNFKGLYGADYDDARGLICGGDFSLPVIRDQWFNYLYNNKNYQTSFDRSIEHMEINNAYARQGEIINAITMGVAGTAAGAYAGAKLGGAVGAVAGATVGAVGNMATAAADLARNERLRNENLDYTRDQFGFQLQNIAARANTLAKVSAFNYNNKWWPFLEYYSCTDTEKEALRNKIKYNGMTVGRIGTISEFITDEPTYIKGRFIRFEGISDDYHIAVAISTELNKGVFI